MCVCVCKFVCVCVYVYVCDGGVYELCYMGYATFRLSFDLHSTVPIL